MIWYQKAKKFASSVMQKSADVVSMNARNLDYVYPSNQRRHYPLADNKLKTKELLEPKGINVPKTYAVYRYFFELEQLKSLLDTLEGFVVKPAEGSGGNGILVIVSQSNGNYKSASGKLLTLEQIKKHIGDIIFGVHSMGLNDIAIIEERLIQHEVIEQLSPYGLADIRLICYNKQPALAMMRIATKASDGKANLHQGGIGIAINMETGLTENAQIRREDLLFHPDNGSKLLGIEVPYWKRVLGLGEEVASSVPLNYLGIDIALTPKGPMVLEINVRPGIEIQNINKKGMRPLLEALA